MRSLKVPRQYQGVIADALNAHPDWESLSNQNILSLVYMLKPGGISRKALGILIGARGESIRVYVGYHLRPKLREIGWCIPVARDGRYVARKMELDSTPNVG